METKYVAIIMIRKELISLQGIIIEICDNLQVYASKRSTNKSEIPDDNVGALGLTKL